MPTISFQQLYPILGTRDTEAAIRFYVERLGFSLTFKDGSVPTNYIALRRGGVEIHMQFQYEYEMAAARLRIRVDDPDALDAEFRARGVAIETPLRDTPWATREFALYDLDGNALTFFRALSDAG